ncbi:MAG: PIN domain nuclease, partial [Thermoprotei archaeon]
MKAFIDANLLIYLNTVKNKVVRAGYERLYFDALRSYKLVTDVLVLDETIFVSWKKYNVPYKVTLSFIEGAVLPYVEILPLGEEE